MSLPDATFRKEHIEEISTQSTYECRFSFSFQIKPHLAKIEGWQLIIDCLFIQKSGQCLLGCNLENLSSDIIHRISEQHFLTLNP